MRDGLYIDTQGSYHSSTGLSRNLNYCQQCRVIKEVTDAHMYNTDTSIS
jgi:hypothetical protein